MTSNGVRISDFRGGSARVTVSYKLKAGQHVSGVHVWFVSDSGAVEEVPTTVGTDEILFTISHFSHYVVTYAAPAATVSYSGRYNDCAKDAACPIDKYIDAVPTAWYHDGVHWALENGVMNGVGGDKFEPNTAANRAMIVTMLYRMEGEPEVTPGDKFQDVKTDAWYAKAVTWAEANGVVNGYGNGKFGPNDKVTREQLVTILYRYAQFKGMDTSEGEMKPLTDFTDARDISDWAVKPFRWAVDAGIINGTGGGKISPKTDASRAQVATMFMRYDAMTK